MLKRIMKENGITLSYLSENTGISEGHLSKIINRRFSNVGIQIILKLSQELDICPVKIFLFLSHLDCKLEKKCCKKFKCECNMNIYRHK